jgi:hypothetical protein
VSAGRWLPILLIAAGVILLAAAITYFVVPAQGLPSFMGFIPGSDVIRWKRGLVLLVVALGCLFFGVRQARGGRTRTP